MRVHADARRTAYCDLFGDATPGDVNVFEVQPNQVTCWHRHQRQTDRFWCLRGSITFRWWRGGTYHKQVLLQGGQTVVTIPPGWWHGYQAGNVGATVVMYLDQKFNLLDEERMSEAESGVPFP